MALLTNKMAAVKELIVEVITNFGPETCRRKMEKAVPSIVAGMQAKGMTPENAALELVIRDALFRLWKAVVKWGDVADGIRDHQDDKVIPLAIAKITDKQDLTAIVKGTLETVLEVTF